MDLLTNLYSKKDLESFINEGTINLEDYNSIILFDMDTLVAINDIYGFAKGDSCLMEFALRLKNTFVEPNLCFRVAGEEFIVLVKNLNNLEELTKQVLENSIDKNCIIDCEYSNISYFSVSACLVKNTSIKNNDELSLKIDQASLSIHNKKEHIVYRKYKNQGVLITI